MVLDTTNSNSGKYPRACSYLELWVGSPILWLACWHHVAEMHVGAAMKEITGATKEPGVQITVLISVSAPPPKCDVTSQRPAWRHVNLAEPHATARMCAV